MGNRTNDKWVNYSYELAQTKQQVGYCVIGTILVHKQAKGIHVLTRLTTAQTWGKPSPSPLSYFLLLTPGAVPKCYYSWDSQVRSPEFFKIKTAATLEAHNFLCRPLIEVRFTTKL
jgi:hypothetical protein